MPQFRPVFEFFGFDESDALRPWQMTPVSGARFVRLVDGQGIAVASTNPAVARAIEISPNQMPYNGGAYRETFSMKDRFFRIEGFVKGNTRVLATSCGEMKASLTVAVTERRTVTLSVHSIRDVAGHQTRRQPTEAVGLVREMNERIFVNQANLEFQLRMYRWVTVARNLGDVVRFSAHLPRVRARQHEWDDVTSQGDAAADVNLFFVWVYEQDRTPYQNETQGGTIDTDCLVEDSADMLTTSAHEIAHALGLDHTTETTRLVSLLDGNGLDGFYLSRREIGVLNP